MIAQQDLRLALAGLGVANAPVDLPATAHLRPPPVQQDDHEQPRQQQDHKPEGGLRSHVDTIAW